MAKTQLATGKTRSLHARSAEQAIDLLFSTTIVPKAETKAELERLRDHIDVLIDSLGPVDDEDQRNP